MSPAAAIIGKDAGARSPLTAVARSLWLLEEADACGTLNSIAPPSSAATAAVTEGRRIDPSPRGSSAPTRRLRQGPARALRYRRRSGHTVRRSGVERVAACCSERPVVARGVEGQQQRSEAPGLLAVL